MKNMDLSRRNFLKGSALTVAGAIAASVMGGCGHGRQHEMTEDGKIKRQVETPEFLKPPALISAA